MMMNVTRNGPVGKTRKKVVVGCKRMESNDARDQESWKESLRRIRPARSGLLLFLTLLYVALYIFESSHSPAPEWAIGLDRVLVLVFASDYALTLFLASKEWYVEAFSFEGVISLASFLPQLLEEMHLDFLPGELAGATRVLRVLRVLRLAVLLPYLQAAGIISKDAVQLRLASLVVTITGLLLTTASIVQVTEKVPWLDALYFVLTTITTVGACAEFCDCERVWDGL